MDFRLHFPATVEDAVAIKKATGGSYLAGGTILMVDRYHGKPVAKDMVSLERIDALHAIKETADTIEIGAACSFTQIEEFPPVKEYLWALYLSATEIGGPQVRNRGTIGGNWCCCSHSRPQSRGPHGGGSCGLLCLQKRPSVPFSFPQGRKKDFLGSLHSFHRSVFHGGERKTTGSGGRRFCRSDGPFLQGDIPGLERKRRHRSGEGRAHDGDFPH